MSLLVINMSPCLSTSWNMRSAVVWQSRALARFDSDVRVAAVGLFNTLGQGKIIQVVSFSLTLSFLILNRLLRY